jgi:hypothetical protein
MVLPTEHDGAERNCDGYVSSLPEARWLEVHSRQEPPSVTATLGRLALIAG